MQLKTLLVYLPSGKLSHSKTGKKARKYRLSLGVKSNALAKRMGWGENKGARITHLENGRKQWTPKIDQQVLKALHEIAEFFK